MEVPPATRRFFWRRPRKRMKPAAFAFLPKIKENVESSPVNVVARLAKAEAEARVP